MKFNSRYTDANKEISASQYIAEKMCERAAQKDGKSLPVRFWNTPEWKKTFLYQLRLANSLLKIYHPSAILAGIKQFPKVYSLNNKSLDGAIQTKQRLLDQQGFLDEFGDAVKTEIKQIEIKETIPEKPRQAFKSGKSALDRLRELENG